MTVSAEYDVCVVGGGPAGSTAATFVAMRGHRVLLLERERTPIYKIGESLLPSTIHGICAMLGVTSELEKANFPRKHGGTFRWGKSKEPWTFAFSESERFRGPTSYAYQVERLKFDDILLKNARAKGVQVEEGCRVTAAIIENDRVVGLEVADASGVLSRVRCRYVVDASGQATILGRHVGERKVSDIFRNIALFGYYVNGRRLPPPNTGNIFCAAFDKGWFWYIPLSDQLTSVGAVIGHEHANLVKAGHEQALRELIDAVEPIRELLSEATRVTEGPYGVVRLKKDFSYCHSTFWRPGLVLCGDAACFIDPVFSSGVHLATYSALLAARSINACLDGTVSEERAFHEFEGRYRREYHYFERFLEAFYDLEQDVDSYYWSARRVTRSGAANREAFIRLVSGTASFVDSLRHANGDAGNGTEETSAGEVPNGGRFWSELVSESLHMQLLAGGDALALQEKPLLKDGLVTSADGLGWSQMQRRARRRTRRAEVSSAE